MRPTSSGRRSTTSSTSAAPRPSWRGVGARVRRRDRRALGERARDPRQRRRADRRRRPRARRVRQLRHTPRGVRRLRRQTRSLLLGGGGPHQGQVHAFAGGALLRQPVPIAVTSATRSTPTTATPAPPTACSARMAGWAGTFASMQAIRVAPRPDRRNGRSAVGASCTCSMASRRGCGRCGSSRTPIVHGLRGGRQLTTRSGPSRLLRDRPRHAVIADHAPAAPAAAAQPAAVLSWKWRLSGLMPAEEARGIGWTARMPVSSETPSTTPAARVYALSVNGWVSAQVRKRVA